MATKQDLLSDKHFSVNVTFIQISDVHTRFVRKHCGDSEGGGVMGEMRSYDTHESTTDAEAC